MSQVKIGGEDVNTAHFSCVYHAHTTTFGLLKCRQFHPSSDIGGQVGRFGEGTVFPE